MSEVYKPSAGEFDKAEEMTSEIEAQAESTRIREEQKNKLAEMGKEGYVLCQSGTRDDESAGSKKLFGVINGNEFVVERDVAENGRRSSFSGRLLGRFKEDNSSYEPDGRIVDNRFRIPKEAAAEIFAKYEKVAIESEEEERLREEAESERKRIDFEQALKSIL